MKSARLEQDRLPGQFFNLTLSTSFLRHGKERRICIDKSRLLADWLFGAKTPSGPGASSFTRFLDHTQRRTPVGRTPLGE